MESQRMVVEEFETKYVYNPYDRLSLALSSTSERRWQIVDAFLSSFPIGAVLADLGCGDGSYLDVARGIHIIGFDRSHGFLEMAKGRSDLNEVVHCNIIKLPVKDGCLDGVICVSVLHHLASRRRRVAVLKEIHRILKPGGRALIVTWAYENNYRQFEGQDVLIPLSSESESATLKKLSPRYRKSSCEKKCSTHSHHIFTKDYRKVDNTSKEDFPTSLSILMNKDLLLQHQASITSIHYFYSSVKEELLALHRKLLDNFSKWGSFHEKFYEMKLLREQVSFHSEKRKLRRVKSLPNLDIYKQREISPLHHSRVSLERLFPEKNNQNTKTCHLTRYYHVFKEDELAALATGSVKGLKQINVSREKGHWVNMFVKEIKS